MTPTTRDALAALVEALDVLAAAHAEAIEMATAPFSIREGARDARDDAVVACVGMRATARTALAAPPVDAGEVVREVRGRLGRTALTPTPDLDDWRLAREHLTALCDLAASQAAEIARLTAERDAARAADVEAMRVYVAAPLGSGDVVPGNVERAMDAADRLLDAGLAPFVPHLIGPPLHARRPREYEAWIALCLAWIRRADAVVRLPGHSPGADREVALARSLGIPVYDSVEACVSALRALAPAQPAQGGEVSPGYKELAAREIERLASRWRVAPGDGDGAPYHTRIAAALDLAARMTRASGRRT